MARANLAGTWLLFDTDCVLCSAWVHFILAHERDAEISFVSAWSPKGLELAASHGLTEADLQRTLLVVEGGVPLIRSAAILAIIRHLKMPYRSLLALRLLPQPLRDTVYAAVARNRYEWFGKRERCFVPPPGMRHRFIDRP